MLIKICRKCYFVAFFGRCTVCASYTSRTRLRAAGSSQGKDTTTPPLVGRMQSKGQPAPGRSARGSWKVIVTGSRNAWIVVAWCGVLVSRTIRLGTNDCYNCNCEEGTSRSGANYIHTWRKEIGDRSENYQVQTMKKSHKGARCNVK